MTGRRCTCGERTYCNAKDAPAKCALRSPQVERDYRKLVEGEYLPDREAVARVIAAFHKRLDRATPQGGERYAEMSRAEFNTLVAASIYAGPAREAEPEDAP